jgi:hypothetical protein
MYSESDIDAAVTAGAISADAARALRNHVAVAQQAPAVDEEHFRLLTGFNDIFVSIAIVLLLAAVEQIGQRLYGPLGGVFVAGTAWGLALYFTAQRRMALPSILLLLAFVGGCAGAVASAGMLVVGSESSVNQQVGALIAAVAAVAGVAAAWLHWRRFMVPITVAAGAVALVGLIVAMFAAGFPDAAERIVWPVLLVAGAGVFAVAMRWDLSDRARRTRRSDVAFWLHLAAAPMIAHSAFQLLGVFDSQIGLPVALTVLALYLVFAFVALAVDRRALLVSGLVYVLYALYALFRSAGAVELGASLTGLVIGSALLTLSAFWHPLRRAAVARLGGWRDRLPPVQLAAA